MSEKKDFQTFKKNFIHQGSISPTFYKQFLCAQNPKVQKDPDDFLCSWVLHAKKFCINRLVKSTQPSISSMFYTSVFCTEFCPQKLQSCVLDLRFFAKILYEKVARKMLMKLTPGCRSYKPVFLYSPNFDVKLACLSLLN